VTSPSPDITGLLARWQRGEPGAEEALLPLIYAELRRIAARELRRERSDHTLQPTALVHELYLELRDCGMEWENRVQFFGFAAHVTRRVLVAHARRRGARKRGGELRKIPLDQAPDPRTEAPSVDLVALDEALERLARIDLSLARIVELRYFGGLTLEETAELLGVSTMTVSRGWQRARAWLLDALTAGPEDRACLTTS
jgi:RNA polymerase sigma factor (TIGR02999 family)